MTSDPISIFNITIHCLLLCYLIMIEVRSDYSTQQTKLKETSWYIKKQELLNLREYLGLPQVFSRIHVAHLFNFAVVLFGWVFFLISRLGLTEFVLWSFGMWWFILVFVLCPVHPMLPVPPDCPFLIVCSVFSNI